LEAVAMAMAPNATVAVDLLLRRGGPVFDAMARVVGRGAPRASIEVRSVGHTQDRQIHVVVGDEQSYSLVAQARQQGLREPMESLLIQSRDRGSSLVFVDGTGQRSAHVGRVARELDESARFVDVEAVRSSGALEDAYTRIDEAGQLPKVVTALARAMSGLTDLRILKVGEGFLLHTFCANGPPVPAYLAGDGFKRFLALASAALNAHKGVVLLEEPESFQHPRYLEELARLLHLAAKDGTQVILSTHSIELIDLLLDAAEGEGTTYPAVHRLRLVDGVLRATTIDREGARIARSDLLEDLRA
jgi:hypothetical protein